MYKKVEEGGDVNFVFGAAYGCPEGYTPLMCAAHRGRLEAARALLRAGADPNFANAAGDLVLFWAVDGGVEMVKLLVEARVGASQGEARGQGKPLPCPRGPVSTPTHRPRLCLPPPHSTARTWTR